MISFSDLRFFYLNNTIYETDDKVMLEQVAGGFERNLRRDDGFVWFFDFTDDTVIKTNDKEIVDGLFNHIGRNMNQIIPCLKKEKLFPFVLSIPFIILKLYLYSKDLPMGYMYILEFSLIAFFYFYLSKKENDRMEAMKNESEIFRIVNDDCWDSRNDSSISVREVKELFHDGLNKNNLKSQITISSVYFIIYSLISPLAGSVFLFVNSFEAMPHNCLRLLLHLRRIEKTQKERI